MTKKFYKVLMTVLAAASLFVALALAVGAEVEGGDIYISKMGSDNSELGKSRWNNTAIMYLDENGAEVTDPAKYVPSGLKWSFDDGVMTVSGEIKKLNGKEVSWEIPYPSSGRTSISEIVITAPITTIPDHCMNYLSSVKKIVWPITVTRLEGEAMARLTSLTTLIVSGKGSNEEGWIDLRNITYSATNTFQDSFPSKDINIMMSGNALCNCSNTRFGGTSRTGNFHIYVPEGFEECKWITSITSGREVKFTVTAEHFPEGAVKELGYQVRTKEYNGLRAKFRYDGTTNDGDYTLIEFGAIAGRYDNIEKYGYTLEKNSFDEYETADISVKKIAINESDLLKDGVFYVSVVNYSKKEQMEAPVFMCAYEIWSDGSGEDKIVYSVNSESHCAPASLYEATVGMYRAGIINGVIEENDLFWDVLKNFRYKPELTEEGLALGDSFGYTIADSGELVEKTNPNVSVNIFKTGETYTAIVRGTGTFTGGAYNAGGATDPVTGKRDWTVRNHLEETYIGIVIDTLILDNGITATAGNSLKALTSVSTIIYAPTLKKLGSQAFHTMKGICTIIPFDYELAKKNPNYVRDRYGVADLSNILSYYSDYLFYLCGKIEQIILPAASGEKGELNERFAGSCSSLKKVYCATADAPEDGIADLRGTGWSFNCEKEHTGNDQGKRVFQFANLLKYIIDDFAEYEKTDEKPLFSSYTGTWKLVK